MGWADEAIRALSEGEEVTVYPRGNSMTPKIRSGARCTIAPVDPSTLRRGEIVLVKVKGSVYLHLISAVDKERVQISNNHGHANGWTAKANVYGKLVAVDNSERR